MTSPNPNLAHVPERDITTPSGRRLTLVNPACMMRQLYNLAGIEEGPKGRITSLKPLYPGNAPSELESEALGRFEAGDSEWIARRRTERNDKFHLMRPMMTEATCLKCHAVQGYKVGEVRGAIHIAVDMSPYSLAARQKNWSDLIRYLLVWFAGILAFFLFIRRMGTLTDALVREKERAEESDRMKSAFLANMSHEVRTPLNGIMGFADLLRSFETTPEKRTEYLGLILSSGDRLLNILNGLIDISKIETGAVRAEIHPVSLVERVEGLRRFFHLAAEEKGLSLSIPQNLPILTIETDGTKLEQILSNLIRNAIQNTDTGTIQFGYEEREEAVEFFVTDTGRGIAKEHQGLVFRRFFRGTDEMGTRPPGAGIGLSISKSYVELLGGKIWLESELGRGSTFRFTLPRR
jgi:signal transduction histidine kinase